MPRDPYSLSASLHGLSGAFVGRQHELRLLDDHLSVLVSGGNGSSRLPILHFHGLSGVGKSRLLQKAFGFHSRGERVRVALFDADGAPWLKLSCNAPDFLWLVRQTLRRTGLRTPLFDFYYTLYYGRANPGTQLTARGLLEAVGSKSASAAEMSETGSGATESAGDTLSEWFDADFLKEVLDGAGDLFRTVGFVAKFVERLHKKKQQHRLEGQDISTESLTLEQMQKQAAMVFSLDLIDHLKSHPDERLLLAVDSIDCIQLDTETTLPSEAESALEALCSFLIFANGEVPGRFSLVSTGSRQLSWRERFDSSAEKDHWGLRITQHPIAGLDDASARSLILEAAGALDSATHTELGERLRSRTPAVLAAALESHVKASREEAVPTYHPLALQLAMRTVIDAAPEDSPLYLGAGMLELLQAYLKAQPPHMLQRLEVLSLLGSFSQTDFANMVEAHMIPSQSVTDFPAMVSANPAIIAEGSGTSFRVHQVLRTAVLDKLLASDPEKAKIQLIQETIIAKCVTEGAFDVLAECETRQTAAISRALSLLVEWHAARLLDLPGFLARWILVEDLFGRDTHHLWSVRRKAIDYIRPVILVYDVHLLADKSPEPSPTGVSGRLVQMAILLRNNDEPEAARNINRVVRAINDAENSRRSPDEIEAIKLRAQTSPGTAFMMIEAAREKQSIGDQAEATKIFHQALIFARKLPQSQDATMARFSASRGLALGLQNASLPLNLSPSVRAERLAAADELYASSIKDGREAGMHALDLALVQIDYGFCLLLTNKLEKLEKILTQAAPVIEQHFPFEHIHAAALLRLRGLLMAHRKRYPQAIELLQKSTAMYKSAAGPDHLFTRVTESEVESTRMAQLGMRPTLSNLLREHL